MQMCVSGSKLKARRVLVCVVAPSHQVVLFEVELQDGVFDGGEHEADVLRVCGAGEVRVDDLVHVGVQVHEHLQDELPAGLGVQLRTWTTQKGQHFHCLLQFVLQYCKPPQDVTV